MLIDAEDFDLLTTTSCKWRDNFDESVKNGRFDTLKLDELINLTYENAYWIETAAGLVLCKAYLKSIGRRFQVILDGTQFVILTGYSGGGVG
jgi:hypothetical protein